MSERSVVLTYHAVGPVPDGPPRHGFVAAPAFERQMAFLARHRRVVPLAEIVHGRPSHGPPRVAITFDDAYRSVLTRAAPVLERHGFPAVMFAPTAWLGQRNGWDPPSEAQLDLLSGEELLELRARGFEICSHGHRHIDLSLAGEDEIHEDLGTSFRILYELLGDRPRYLAYPYGRSSVMARQAAREVGFAEAFALEWEDAPFARSRTPIFPRDSGWRFAFKSSGRYEGFRRARPVAGAYARLVRPLRRS